MSLNELNDEVSSKLQQALDSVASMRKDDSGESQRKMEGMEKVLVQLSKGIHIHIYIYIYTYTYIYA